MTYIKQMTVKNFRLIDEIKFEPSKYVNIISGTNGTGKSTILGMIAQGFSFNNRVATNYVSPDCTKLTKKKFQKLDPIKDKTLIEEYQSLLTYFGQTFESESNEHFRLSEKDVRETEHIHIELNDGDYFKVESTNHAKKLPRFVTRRKNGTSSNYVHPVIYLGLDRLIPLVKTKNTSMVIDLSESDIEDIHTLYESILLKTYSRELSATKTDTNKQTAAYIDPSRTIEMISSGEDIVGQLLLALYSFKKLKSKFPDEYKGGILLIDEIDATLYPAAQNKLIDIILEKARAWDIQVFATSHSLSLLEYIESKKTKNQRINRDIKLFTTDNSKGTSISIKELEYLYEFKNQLLAKMNQKTVPNTIKLYFEDKEAQYIFKKLLNNTKDSSGNPVRQRLKIMSNVSLSSTNYINLHKNKVPEFYNEAIVCLDGDQQITQSQENFITLPVHDSKINPEEFIFKILDNSNSNFWENTTSNYSHAVFMNNSKYHVIKSIQKGTYETEYQNVRGEFYKTKPREVWKAWFNEEKENWKGKNEPITYWKNENSKNFNNFFEQLKRTYDYVAKNNKIPPL